MIRVALAYLRDRPLMSALNILLLSLAVAMLVMFLVASIPMIDKRSVERRPEYQAHMARVSGFVPWFPKHSS